MGHDKSKSFPPLAPGPPRPLPMQASTAVSRPKKNSTACQACKTAKRKCSGSPAPCKACVRNQSENDCHFDPSRDLRRKVAVKQTIRELSDYKELLETLLATLQVANPEQVREVLELIQSKASMEEIAHAVDCRVKNFADSRKLSSASQLSMSVSEDSEQGLETTMTEGLGDKLPISLPEDECRIEPSGAAFDPYARVTLESLCDMPLYQVPATPWTQVTDDDNLVSHLVSLYFTWDHPCTQFLDQGIFIEHMRMRVLDSEFCTPLLVNSLLSMASAHSDSPHIYSDLKDPFSRGDAFYAEAERLWKAEEGRPSLSNIQALLMMCCVLSYQGKANLGWLMLQQAAHMALDIGLLVLPGVRSSKQMLDYDNAPTMERVRGITAWGISNFIIQMSMKLKRVTILSQPAYEADIGGDHDLDWTPYPRSNQIAYAAKRAHLPQVRQGLADLTAIMLQIEKLRHDKELESSFDLLMAKAEMPYNQLQELLSSWPTASQVEKEPISQLLILRIKCLCVAMHLVELLIERDYQLTKTSQLRQTWFAQAEEMAQCLHIHRQSYGIKHIPSQVTDAVQTALQALVNHLEDFDGAEQVFIEIWRFGVALGQKFKSTAETIKTIRFLSRKESVELPREAIAILDGTEC